MKPVNKTRRTTEHASMLEETRVYCKNSKRIIRVKEKRASRKADRSTSKIMIKIMILNNEYDHGPEEFEYEPSVTGYDQWKYMGKQPISVSEFTDLPWWKLLGKVRYQDNNWVWYR